MRLPAVLGREVIYQTMWHFGLSEENREWADDISVVCHHWSVYRSSGKLTQRCLVIHSKFVSLWVVYIRVEVGIYNSWLFKRHVVAKAERLECRERSAWTSSLEVDVDHFSSSGNEVIDDSEPFKMLQVFLRKVQNVTWYHMFFISPKSWGVSLLMQSAVNTHVTYVFVLFAKEEEG